MIKSYGFWTALAGAIVVLVQALGECFGFAVKDEVVSGVVMAIAGVLVVCGVVTMPKKKEEDKSAPDQNESDDEKDEDGESDLNSDSKK